MNLCGTCKYWGIEIDLGERFRQCQAIHQDKEDIEDTVYNPIEGRDWLEAEEIKRLQELERTTKALAIDGSGYFAAIRCREDFGCVLHEPREEGK